ncbi:MAG: isoprenylcysteine carboxylmethyltransferase family protein [Zestosphaera sp.]
MGKRELLISVVFSALFSLTLVYASIEVIKVVNNWMLGFIPDCILLSDFPRCQELESGLRIFGYVGLVCVVIIIGAGFLLNKVKLSLLGSLTLYLPTIGHFAFTMFFLAGIGVLRLLWLPFIDSEVFIRLGLITYVPMWAINTLVTWVAKLVVPELSGDFFVPVCFAIMIVGLTVFFLGVMTWVNDRLQKRTLSVGGVYKFSRHPQYLGFIVWSYGFLSLASAVEEGRGWSPPVPGLPWVVVTAIILGAALVEEVELRSKLGDEYICYLEHTPFMILMPKVLKNVVAYPARILIGKEMPTTRREVFTVVLAYLALIMFTSFLISYLIT